MGSGVQRQVSETPAVAEHYLPLSSSLLNEMIVIFLVYVALSLHFTGIHYVLCCQSLHLFLYEIWFERLTRWGYMGGVLHVFLVSSCGGRSTFAQIR